MHTKKPLPSCWVITEGLRGTENQCVGIVEMLGITPIIKTVTLKQPWKTLSPYIKIENSSSFSGDSIAPPYPDILITGGRKAIAASRYIKKRNKEKTFTVHVMDPKVSPQQFDLVTVPAHDTARGDNVIVTKATPNRITVKNLQQGREKFSFLSDLPSPRVAVLIGGNSRCYNLDMEIAKKLVHDLKIIQGSNRASLMVTMSRRTPVNVQKFIKNALCHNDHTYIWDDKDENPYFGFLAYADYILATADSTSMLSEACTTGVPTYMIPTKETKPTGRIKTLQQNLMSYGGLRLFDGQLDSWSYTPLNDSQLVALEIKKRLPDCF